MPSDSPSPPEQDAAAWLRDWITLWQSELAAMIADREMQEQAQALVGLWAASAEAALPFWAEALKRRWPNDRSAGRAGPAAPAGTAPPAAAPQDGGAREGRAAAENGGDADELARLRRQIAALERRLAALEGRARSPRRA